MQFKVTTYIPGESCVHQLDTRVKLVLLLAYSITLFCVQSWLGIGLCLSIFILLALLSRLPLCYINKLMVPLYIIVAFTIIFNAFTLDVTAVNANYEGISRVLNGTSLGAPLALIGNFGFIPDGFARGCFYALRIILLVAASLIVCLTSTSTDMTEAFNAFLRPLRRFHVPSDDIAMVFSIALRFIPITAEELVRLRNAQWSRGAAFSSDNLTENLRAWQTVLIPLFVNLNRRADLLACGMDARCYGQSTERSQLHVIRLRATSLLVLVCGLFACLALGILL